MAKSPHERHPHRMLDDELLDYLAIKDRCGPHWETAWAMAQDLGYKLPEFASTKWDCRECPFFLRCVLENRFENPNHHDFLNDLEE